MSITIKKMDEFTKNSKYPPTPNQWQAISTTGCDILVAAAAGSGKTQVLSERIARRVVVDKWDIDKMLILTFTKDAAKNMLIRIEKNIETRLLSDKNIDNQEKTYEEKEKDLEFLKRQRLLLGNASITTIDAFCLSLLKKFYYLAFEKIDNNIHYLSPNFKILANNTLLLTSSMNKSLEEFAHQQPEELNAIFDFFNHKDTVLKFFKSLYDKILSQPNYKTYIDKELTKNIEVKFNIKSLLALQAILYQPNVINKKQSEIITSLENIQAILKLEQESIEKISQTYENIIEINSFSSNTDSNDIEHITSIINYLQTENTILETHRLYLLDFIKTTITQFKLISGIKNLLKKIDNDFIKEKRKNNYLDFADLNHLTIQLLKDKTVTTYYKNYFKEIYVDEYQDNNNLQEYILNQIRGENVYFFRVGDVKQAIYGFRNSNPELFEEKYRAYKKITNYIQEDQYSIDTDYQYEHHQTDGLCIILKENFRSVENVLNTSNFIFNHLMHNQAAGISYDSDSALYYPKLKKELDNIKNDPACYLITPQQQKFEGNEAIILIAKEINKRLLEGYTYSDFAILLPKSNKMPNYKKVLEAHGIPVYYKEKENFTDSHAFNILFNFLKFVDNPTDDAALLVLLASPIFNFSNNELLELAMEDSKLCLFEKLQLSHLDLAKIAKNTLNKWINYTNNNSISDSINYVIEDSNLNYYLQAKDMDDSEIDYLDNFLDILRDLENQNTNISYIVENMTTIKIGQKYESRRKEPHHAVKLVTIHASKGLEYEYVFVAELNGEFPANDYTSNYNYSGQLGLIIADEKQNHLLLNINKIIIKKYLTEENIRLLYVALTRAVKGLYLVSNTNLSLDKKSLELENSKGKVSKIIKEDMINSKSSYKSFTTMLNLVLSYYTKENLDPITENNTNILILESFDLTEQETNNNLSINIHKDLPDFEIGEIAEKYIAQKEIFPSKTSYSLMKKLRLENNDKPSHKKEAYLKLNTLSKKTSKNDALLKGNAVHKLFEKIVKDSRKGKIIGNILDYLYSIKKTKDSIKNIQEERILDEEEFNILLDEKEITLIEKFVKNDLFEIIKNSKSIETEILFTTPKKLSDIYTHSHHNHTIILQGVIDLLIKLDDTHYIIVDYKTDVVPKKDGKTLLKDRHFEQLDIYAKACKNYYGNHISVEKYIYSYTLAKLIAL